MLFANNDVWEPDKVQWMQLAKWAFWGTEAFWLGGISWDGLWFGEDQWISIL
jgi:hypothetical protein